MSLESVSPQLNLERMQENSSRLSVSFASQPAVNFIIQPANNVSGVYLRTLRSEQAANRNLTIVDVYPLNGTAKTRNFSITDFVRKNHREELAQHLALLDERDPERKFVRCLVIDFKDTTNGYRMLDQISLVERAFASFFKESQAQKSDTQACIYGLFRTGKIQFFINEGSLKANLLKHTFTAMQADFFQSTES